MSVFDKIIRVFLIPYELKLYSIAGKYNREIGAYQGEAQRIALEFKKAIHENPEIQGFIENYDKKTIGRGLKFY